MLHVYTQFLAQIIARVWTVIPAIALEIENCCSLFIGVIHDDICYYNNVCVYIRSGFDNFKQDGLH